MGRFAETLKELPEIYNATRVAEDVTTIVMTTTKAFVLSKTNALFVTAGYAHKQDGARKSAKRSSESKRDKETKRLKLSNSANRIMRFLWVRNPF